MKSISRKTLNYSGIYCIINTVNNKKYIGSSKHLSRRLWEHRATLRHNCHVNQHLQNAWNKYGEAAFDYFIIERCDESNLIEREQWFINTLKPEYNQIFEIVKPLYTKESRQKLSESRKKAFKEGRIKKYQSKKIYQYDLEGNFIQSYNSIKEACLETKTSRSHLRDYFNGTYSQCGGFLWSLTPDAPKKYTKPVRKLPTLRKPVKVVSETETLFFDSLKSCAEHFNIHYACVVDCIKHKRLFRKKYRMYRISPVEK